MADLRVGITVVDKPIMGWKFFENCKSVENQKLNFFQWLKGEKVEIKYGYCYANVTIPKGEKIVRPAADTNDLRTSGYTIGDMKTKENYVVVLRHHIDIRIINRILHIMKVN